MFHADVGGILSYTYNRGKAGGYHLSPEVLRHQVDILEASVHTQQPTDRLIRVSVTLAFSVPHRVGH